MSAAETLLSQFRVMLTCNSANRTEGFSTILGSLMPAVCPGPTAAAIVVTLTFDGKQRERKEWLFFIH